MECSCTVANYGGDYYHEMINVRIPVARKQHECVECRKTIEPGEKYEYLVQVYGGDFQTYKTCLDCRQVVDIFFSDGGTFGRVWPDLRQSIIDSEGEIPEDCIKKLSPVNLEKVCAIIEECYED